MEKFDHAKIEQLAQEKWASLNLYETDLSAAKDPYYLLFEFPYPSGDLHIGHWYAFALTDIYARYKRMQGKDVLFPMGFDSFGLPAENAAIRNGVDPKEWTYANMDRMRTQIRAMGTSVDWSKEVVSSDPEYYRWTQWLFGKLYEHDLAERRTAPVKWCPKDQTVLANEQVIDGKCERCGTEVEEKHLTQWFLKITKYAKRLLEDLETLPWREEIKEAQRAWIGESEGAHISFPIAGTEESVSVFTTRADTLFGVTYVVLAPEHPLVGTLSVENKEEVETYVGAVKRKSERERLENKEKTGVELKGVKAINPATKEEIPVYIADYVLATYGTGAVMAVPFHDERDLEFTKKFHLPVKQVVMPVTGEPHPEENRREGGCAIVFDPATQRYAVLKRNTVYRGLCAGGMDPDEDMIDCILREVTEESGLHNFKYVEYVGSAEAHYFNAVKKKYMVADAACALVILDNADTVERKLEEHEVFETDWVTAAEIQEEWKEKGGRNTEHWLWFLKQGVGRAIELGFDTTSDPKVFVRQAYGEDGPLISSGEFTGRNNQEALWDIVASVGGERVTNFRIRDWLVSRQRYWGCPIPIVYDPEGKAHLIPSEHLPWTLPIDVDFTPTGKSPLATSNELKERVTKLFGEGWTPEYDTLDTFVDSSWYFLRYLDPKDEHNFSDQGLLKKWLPVDRYSGGSEHTTMHLLYARFFHKALYDLALVPTPEPFGERFNRGLILGPDGAKMSKSKGNVVNPDEFVKKFGADAVRMYLAFIGPYNEPGSYPWNLDGVVSMRRFLDRIHALKERVADIETSPELARSVAKAVSKVSSDTERFKFNTGISALMIFVRDLEGEKGVPKEAYRTLLILLAPYAPHLAEHLWESLGEEGSVHQAAFPEASEGEVLETVTVIVQVNGKKKGEVTLSPEANEEEAIAAARGIPSVAELLHEAAPSRTVYVPGRILNLVVDKV